MSGVTPERLRRDGAQPLCEPHAAKLHAPGGWRVLDDRPRPTPPETPRAVRRTVPLRRRWGGFDPPSVTFGVEGSEADRTITRTEPVEPLHMTEAFARMLSERREPPAPRTLRPEDGPAIDWTSRHPGGTAASPASPGAAVTREVHEPEVHEPEVHVPAQTTGPGGEHPSEPATEEPGGQAPATTSRRRVPAPDDPLGKPKGRMLSRAFAATGDQRSVLTDPLGLGTGRPTRRRRDDTPAGEASGAGDAGAGPTNDGGAGGPEPPGDEPTNP